MTQVMAVTFVEYGQLYYADANNVSAPVGSKVLIETSDGPEVAHVVWLAECDTADLVDLPKCVGIAAPKDLERDASNRRRKAEITEVSRQLIAAHHLPMKVVGVDFTDRSEKYGTTVAIYYTAPGRVDFRALVSDLAGTLQARVDLRQVGARDAAQLIGGIGSCGRDLCCTSFKKTFEPISMKMARDQDVAGNLMQIQGQCGKLKCCLAYEHDQYVQFDATAPATGSRVRTPDGAGTVVGRSVPLGIVRVRTADGVTACSAGSCTPIPGRPKR